MSKAKMVTPPKPTIGAYKLDFYAEDFVPGKWPLPAGVWRVVMFSQGKPIAIPTESASPFVATATGVMRGKAKDTWAGVAKKLKDVFAKRHLDYVTFVATDAKYQDVFADTVAVSSDATRPTAQSLPPAPIGVPSAGQPMFADKSADASESSEDFEVGGGDSLTPLLILGGGALVGLLIYLSRKGD